MKPNKKSILLLILVFWVAMTVATAQENPRVALVIGNGDYQDMGQLTNPPNDARDMAAALRSIGFEVEMLIDADVVDMEDAIVEFGRQLGRSRDSVGFFFYAGHGVQSQGENYLIPSKARISSEVFLRSRSISAQVILDTMQAAANNLNIVVLDACRDNPFSWSRSGQRGLSQVSYQPPGSIIAYATSAGDIAQDGTGRNGVFTSELLNHLTTQSIDVSEAFRRTGEGVRDKSNGKQVPAVYSQFFDQVNLAPNSLGVSTTPIASFSYSIINSNEIEITGFFGSEREVVIPDRIDGKPVTSIGNGAFKHGTNLTSVWIPGSVTSIGNWTSFVACENLTRIVVADRNTNFKSIGGILFNKTKTKLIAYPPGLMNNHYKIPDSVTSIDDFAFQACVILTSITIPDSVTSIGYWAFVGCTSLTSITIPDSVNSIGIFAFDDCDNLTDIYCAAISKPSGWNTNWISSSATIHWGHRNQ